MEHGAGGREQGQGEGRNNMVGEQRLLWRVSKRDCYDAANSLVMLEINKLITTELKQTIIRIFLSL